ncbi:MAG: endonuclease/exonuclease/phosphatase family protein [Acidimicrobiia bacterium]
MLIVSFVGYCLGIATLVGFFGGSWWVLDLFAGFRHQLAAGLIVCTLIAVLAKWKKTAVAIGLLAVVNLVLVVPLFFGPSRPDSGELRILSFNVLASNRRFEEVIDFIRETDADVVVLHEVTSRWEDAIEEASLTFEDWPYEVTETRAPGDLFGSIVLVVTGADVESFGFGLRDPRAIEILLPDGVAVLAVHPLSPSSEFRAEQNDRQFQFAADWVAGQEGPAIIVGDFNATPWSYPFRRLLSSTDLSNSARGFGLDLSYPADGNPLLRIPIDHLLFSDGLAVVDRRLGPAMGSDHFPLTVDLALIATS